VESFCSKYFGVADSTYAMSVSQYMWTGMAGRVLDAGCQLDMTPVFVGDQGDGKSTGIMALVPETDMATEISFTEDDDKTTRKMRGILVAEIAELKGLNTRDAESIKAFLTRRHDRIKPLYAEFTVDIPRRCMFIGTTNNHGFLGDETGERRWLPMVSGKVDREAIKRDRDQLWGEAAHLYKKHGIMWDWAQHLAKDEHCNFKDEDLWLPKVEAWLRQIEAQNERHLNHPKSFDHLDLTTSGILIGALEIDPRNLQKRDELRIGKVMAALGYKKQRLRLNGTARKYYWFKG
jgi:predicted P-loop ATPase